MAADTMRQRSLEGNILFMQQEHASTLKCLHGEIHKLQKRCSDLTFQLAMETTSTSQEDFYRAKTEELASELKVKVALIETKEEECARHVQRVRFLEEQLKAHEIRYQGELKNKNQIIKQLHIEVDTKANTIADLMSKLHTRHSKMADIRRPPSPPRTSSTSPRENEYSSPESAQDSVSPREAVHSNYIRRRSHTRKLQSDKNPILNTAVIPRPPSGRRISGPFEMSVVDFVPDPAPFLHNSPEWPHVDVDETKLSKKQPRAPLPPISHKDDPVGLVPQGTQSLAFFKRKLKEAKEKTPSISSEIHSLALDQIKDQNIRRTQEYNSET